MMLEKIMNFIGAMCLFIFLVVVGYTIAGVNHTYLTDVYVFALLPYSVVFFSAAYGFSNQKNY